MGNGIKNKSQPIRVADLDIAIDALNKYVDDPAIEPLVAALEALKDAPEDEASQAEVLYAFSGLGILQGAALTYAPYLNVFVSDDPFGDKPA